MSASTEASAIIEYYKRKSIFITGATGWEIFENSYCHHLFFNLFRFIGKQLVEKLVRSCPGKWYQYIFIYPRIFLN